jgi:hypothetical protein
VTQIVIPLKYIIGVDPGDSMGIFALRMEEKRAVRMHSLQGTVSEAVVWLEETLERLSKSGAGVLVACERYTVTPETGKRSQQPTALQAIGTVKMFTERYGTRLVMQPPGDAKGIASNFLLKRLGFYTFPKEVGQKDANDVNDAARHATLALSRFKASVFDAMLAATETSP